MCILLSKLITCAGYNPKHRLRNLYDWKMNFGLFSEFFFRLDSKRLRTAFSHSFYFVALSSSCVWWPFSLSLPLSLWPSSPSPKDFLNRCFGDLLKSGPKGRILVDNFFFDSREWKWCWWWLPCLQRPVFKHGVLAVQTQTQKVENSDEGAKGSKTIWDNWDEWPFRDLKGVFWFLKQLFLDTKRKQLFLASKLLIQVPKLLLRVHPETPISLS